jgi:hypothetical protein
MVSSSLAGEMSESAARPFIAPLRLPPKREGLEIAESGYRNVYRVCRPNRDGLPMWHAKIKRGRHLQELKGSRHTEPWRAAVHVARWYASEYGPDWSSVLAARKKNPFLVRKNPDGPGFYAVVWIEGKRHDVVRLVRVPLHRRPWETWERRPNEQLFFWTPKDARNGAWLYAARLLGLLAYASLYRLAPRRAA